MFFPAGLEDAVDIEVAAAELGIRVLLTRGSMNRSQTVRRKTRRLHRHLAETEVESRFYEELYGCRRSTHSDGAEPARLLGVSTPRTGIIVHVVRYTST